MLVFHTLICKFNKAFLIKFQNWNSTFFSHCYPCKLIFCVAIQRDQICVKSPIFLLITFLFTLSKIDIILLQWWHVFMLEGTSGFLRVVFSLQRWPHLSHLGVSQWWSNLPTQIMGENAVFLSYLPAKWSTVCVFVYCLEMCWLRDNCHIQSLLFQRKREELCEGRSRK